MKICPEESEVVTEVNERESTTTIEFVPLKMNRPLAQDVPVKTINRTIVCGPFRAAQTAHVIEDSVVETEQSAIFRVDPDKQTNEAHVPIDVHNENVTQDIFSANIINSKNIFLVIVPPVCTIRGCGTPGPVSTKGSCERVTSDHYRNTGCKTSFTFPPTNRVASAHTIDGH